MLISREQNSRELRYYKLKNETDKQKKKLKWSRTIRKIIITF